MTPRATLTLGVYGSASTWVFNVAREMLNAAYGSAQVAAYYADSMANLLTAPGVIGRYVVVKMHNGDASLAGFIHLAQPLLLLSLRDPRDAVVSMMARFAMPFAQAASGVGHSARVVLACAEMGFPVLRYEDRFFDRPETLDTLAGALDVTLSPEVKAEIFARYQTAAVRALAATVETLPAARLEGDPAVDVYDRVTQIHRNHIGDGASGKWRTRLTPEEQRQLCADLAPVLAGFNYPPA
jgi:hypothetical protein